MNKHHTLSIVKHANGGYSVYLNDRRIAGAKPWGGGTEVFASKVDPEDIKAAIEEVKP